MLKIIKYVLVDILRSRVALAYTLLLLIVSISMLSFDENTSKGILSLLNITLILVPLMSLVYSTIYMYNSSEFIELLLSQPIERKKLFTSLYLGITFALLIAFVAGVAVPVIISDPSATTVVFSLAGMILTAIFVSFAMLATVYTRDKTKGIGAAIILWLYFTLMYDAILLLLMLQVSDYPIEKALIVFCSINPIDMTRVVILMQLDIAALMGVTGALFVDFFGSTYGMIISFVILICWVIVPMIIAKRKFNSKDL
ncbi:MAG: ABC transporter permease [Bacteroidetes bacterium]|nr:ABC transporter permease [Bacteroidota bacterium]